MKKLIFYFALLVFTLQAVSCQDPQLPVVEEPVPEKPYDGFVEAVPDTVVFTNADFICIYVNYITIG